MMNAGSSERSYEFIARYADIMLHTNSQMADLDDARQRIRRLKELAREHDRELQVWTYTTLCSRDTDAEAQEYFDSLQAQESWAQQGRGMDVAGLETLRRETRTLSHLSDDEFRDLCARAPTMSMLQVLGSFFVLVGSHDRIVEKLLAYSEAGLDGLIVVWPSWQDDVPQFEHELLPRLEQAGLRKPRIGFPNDAASKFGASRGTTR
jgi:alkanesulfonate monooxygenase SsuD/methylene tetrahydromethanopterin reductase-like flavin-dependent oxidoreductase (luciferase family)